MSAPIDWATIRAEYIARGTPYRELAEKYGVHLRSVARHAKLENWAEARKKSVNSVVKRSQQKAESVAVSHVDRFFVDAEKLLKKTEQLLNLEDPLSPRDLKALSGTLSEVKLLLGIRDPKDREEQQARIDKMTAEVKAMKESSTAENKIEVVWVNNAWDEDIDETGAGQAK